MTRRLTLTVLLGLLAAPVYAQLPHDLNTIPDFSSFPGALVVRAGETFTLPAEAPPVIVVDGGALLCPATGTVNFTTIHEKAGLFDCLMAGQLVKRDSPLGPLDPDQWGGGIVVTGGTVRLIGTPKTAFVRLAVGPMAGQQVVTLAVAPVGWLAGDTVLFPDTRQLDRSIAYAPVRAWRRSVDQTERQTIASISGTQLVLNAPLAFAHAGALDKDGRIAALPHVGNLTRSLTVRSENPLGTRGHLLFAHHAAVTLEGVAIQGMGRTTADALDPTTNHIGRYGLHLHHLMAGMGSFLARNIAIDDANKWGMAIHDSHGGTVEDSVFADTDGAGIVFEQGNESNVTIRRNFFVQQRGSLTLGQEDATNFAADGIGIWAKGLGSAVVIEDNVFAGGNDALVLAINATTQTRRNEIYGYTMTGLTLWGLGLFNESTAIDTLTAWHIGSSAVGFASVRDLLLANLTVYGDPSKPAYNALGGVTGIRGDAALIRVTNFTAAGLGAGIYLDQHGYSPNDEFRTNFLVDRCDISADVAIIHARNSPGLAENDATQTTTIRDCLLRSTGWEDGSPRLLLRFPRLPVKHYSSHMNTTLAHRFLVYNHQRVAGDDFELFRPEQNGDQPMPNSGTWIGPDGYTYTHLIGGPEAGLTNAQSWAKYGVTFSGRITPCTTTRVGVSGFACPITDAPAPPPPQPPPPPDDDPPPPPPPVEEWITSSLTFQQSSLTGEWRMCDSLGCQAVP